MQPGDVKSKWYRYRFTLFRGFRVNFTFAEVEQALALTFDIAAARRTAFRARIQHLQKLKFPAGTNTGRGRAAVYTPGHLYLLGVAFELQQLGLSPERAKGVIEDDLHAVGMAGSMAASVGFPSCTYESPAFLYCDPAALRPLMNVRDGEDWASQTFFYGGLGSVRESFERWFKNGVQRMAFFSVSALLYDLACHAPRIPGKPTVEPFYEAVRAWADPFIHNVSYSLDRPEQPYWDTIDQSETEHDDNPQA